jgi:beta-lactamase superfamily II metal-dependent hydrolase
MKESSESLLVNESNFDYKSSFEYVKSLEESWNDEALRESVDTSAKNEMSIVILGNMDEENFLLTGDAGIRALDMSISYAEDQCVSIKDTVKFLQVPHHGGRHNLSPSIMDRLVGGIVEEGKSTDKTAFVSVALNSDHPLQMVVNAFIRRGVRVYKTNGNIIHHSKGDMPARSGWSSLTKLEFDDLVEEWDD